MLTPSAHLLHDASYLVVEEPGHSAEELAQLAAKVVEREALSAITVAPLDAREAQRLAGDFHRMGWRIERGVHMVHRRAPDGRAAHQVTEVGAIRSATSFVN